MASGAGPQLFMIASGLTGYPGTLRNKSGSWEQNVWGKLVAGTFRE